MARRNSDLYITEYESIIFVGYVNLEIAKLCVQNVCKSYNQKCLIKTPIGVKNLENSSNLDLILRSDSYSFQSSFTMEKLACLIRMITIIERIQKLNQKLGIIKCLMTNTDKIFSIICHNSPGKYISMLCSNLHQIKRNMTKALLLI